MRAWQPKDKREERETPGPLAPLFMIFLPPWACLCKLGQPGVLCSTWGPHSGPWTFHCSIFTGFPLPCLLATAILESFFLFYLPNRCIRFLGFQDTAFLCCFLSFFLPDLLILEYVNPIVLHLLFSIYTCYFGELMQILTSPLCC